MEHLPNSCFLRAARVQNPECYTARRLHLQPKAASDLKTPKPRPKEAWPYPRLGPASEPRSLNSAASIRRPDSRLPSIRREGEGWLGDVDSGSCIFLLAFKQLAQGDFADRLVL